MKFSREAKRQTVEGSPTYKCCLMRENIGSEEKGNGDSGTHQYLKDTLRKSMDMGNE